MNSGNSSGNVYGPCGPPHASSPHAGRERTADATQLPLNSTARSRWGRCRPRRSRPHRDRFGPGSDDRLGLTYGGPQRVAITLKAPDSQFIAAILNRQFIVPQHVWSKVSDPATYLNSNPVGSGPFDKISRFTTQDYVFAKNPNYWQAGLPKVSCLEYVQAASNDSALALIQSGQVDWTHNFVPNVAQAYVSKDPKHFHAFYATAAYPISLLLDDTQYPYSLVAFRKALSLAIDRSSVSKLGEYGYAPPVDAIGLGGLFPGWVTDAGVKAQGQAMATYNPAAAKKMLTEAGFTYKG